MADGDAPLAVIDVPLAEIARDPLQPRRVSADERFDVSDQSTVAGACKRGGGVGVDTLARLCEAAGYVLELKIRPTE